MALIVKCNNGIVTDEYLNLIGKALKEAGVSVEYTDNYNDALSKNKHEIIVVARTVEAYKLITRGYTRVIVWFQGIEPEESYMSHHSRMRYFVLSHMEKKILKRGSFFIFVSEEMMRHYEKKYRMKIEQKKSYIMPCQNTEFHPESFKHVEKYKRNIFVYTGSMAVWQKFEDTVKAYKMVETKGIDHCELWVFTSEKDEAKRILEKYGVKKYKIDYVSNNELAIALSDAKYGFIIREDNLVNRVATPTKISTYLSCGLIPIYSSCLKDFSSIATNMAYKICYDKSFIEEVTHFSRKEIKNEDVFDEFYRIFDTYYNVEKHKNALANRFNTALLSCNNR